MKNSCILALQAIVLAGCSLSVAQRISDPQELSLKQNDTVILAHGYARSESAMWLLAKRIENAGFQVCGLDYSTIGQSVSTVLAESESQINACVSTAEQSAKVHFVGHSLGGLVIRSYLEKNEQFRGSEQRGRVVLMGTPNHGSEVADYYQDTWLMSLGGNIAEALVTSYDGLASKLQPIDIRAGVIAGTKSSDFTRKMFSGANDGLVSVESTKLAKMADFIVLPVGHSQMRYDRTVAQQTIYFLNHGVFNKGLAIDHQTELLW